MRHHTKLFGTILIVPVVFVALASAAVSQESGLVPRGNEKPSFDCTKAKTAAARLICADGELAQLDGNLGTTFQRRRAQVSGPDRAAFVAEEMSWIRDRNTRCELVGKDSAPIEALASSKACMVSLIQERISILAQAESAVEPDSGNVISASRAIPAQSPITVQNASKFDANQVAALIDKRDGITPRSSAQASTSAQTQQTDSKSGGGGGLLLLFLIGLYFLPSIVGSRHHNSSAIFVLNLFLGWTFIGWVVALVWACTKPASDVRVVRE